MLVCVAGRTENLRVGAWPVETEEIKMIAKSRVTSQVAQDTDKYETNSAVCQVSMEGWLRNKHISNSIVMFVKVS